MKFSRQEYWSRLPLPIPGDRPDPGIKPVSLASPAVAGRFFSTSATWGDQGSLDGYVCMHAKSLQLCLTLCDIMDCSTPRPPRLLFRARILEWVIISSSRGSSQPRDQTRISYASCISRWVLYLNHLLTGIFLYIEKVLSA